MNVFEFILVLVGMIIIGLWGLLVIAGQYNMLDDLKDNEDEKE